MIKSFFKWVTYFLFVEFIAHAIPAVIPEPPMTLPNKSKLSNTLPNASESVCIERVCDTIRFRILI